MREKKEKEIYEPVQGLLGDAADYHVYEMRPQDRIIAAALGFAVSVVVVYVFFRSILFGVLGGVLLLVPAQRLYRNYKIQKRGRTLLLQFKDLLESLAASYSAGQNTMGAFREAKGDMVSVYGEDADIAAEVELILEGMNNNLQVEELLFNFAARSGLSDVESFANVFEVANRQGSNLKQIIADSREIINDKIEIEMEIETMLQANKNELNVMILMPLVIVPMLGGLGASTIAANTPVNVGIKLVCIAIFAGAYLAGRKLTDITI